MKLTDLEMLRVVTEDGRQLGHVFDVRAHGRPAEHSDQRMGPVDHLVYGTLGLLERLGIRRAPSRVLKWEQVVEIVGDRIVVRLPADSGDR